MPLFGVKHARAMHMQGQHLGVFELISGLGLHIVPIGARRGFSIAHHEGQLKHLHTGEPPGGVARKRPDDVGHAVLDLLIELRWRAAQLHGRVALKLDATAGFQLDPAHPGFVHVEPNIRLGGHEGVELQGDGLLGPNRQARRRQGHRGHRLNQPATAHHASFQKLPATLYAAKPLARQTNRRSAWGTAAGTVNAPAG